MELKLPHKINIVVHIEPDGGFWAEFPDLSGCYTQGDDLGQFAPQVQDALLTYFDVPRSRAKKIQPNITISGKGIVDLKPVVAR